MIAITRFFMISALLFGGISAAPALAQSTYRQWLSGSGTGQHPAFDKIEADQQAGLLSHRDAVELKLRRVLAPETVASEYALLDLGDPIRCLTPLLLEAQHAGIDTDAIMALNAIQEVQNQQTLLSPMGLFELRYTTTGRDSVSTKDLNQNGIPDYIEHAAAYADSSWRHQVVNLGFPNPIPDLEKPMPILFRNLGSGIYGQMDFRGVNSTLQIHSTFNNPVFQRNDDEDKVLGALKVTISHEFKHAVQSMAIANGTDPYRWIEMDATLMEEVVFDNVNDYYNYLNNAQSLYRNPARGVVPGNYYHSSWSIYFSERLGIDFWVDTWAHFPDQNPKNFLGAMKYAMQLRDVSFPEEVTRSYLWHLASGSLSNTDYGFSESDHYPDIDITQVISGASTDIQFSVPTLGSISSRLYLIHYDAVNSASNPNEELRLKLTNTQANLDLRIGLLAFYNDGTVEEFIPGKESATELTSILPFDTSRLKTLGIAVVNAGTASTSAIVSLNRGVAVSINETEPELATHTELHPAYPNPFNPSANLSFTLAEASPVRLEVLDLLGRRVATLLDTALPAGRHHQLFDARSLSSGMYLVRFVHSKGIETQKVTLIK